MADDTYMDEDLDQPIAAPGAATDSKEEAVEGDVATLPRSFCPDMELEPGTTFKVRVEKVFEDEVLVSYVRGKDGDEPAPEDDSLDPLMD